MWSVTDPQALLPPDLRISDMTLVSSGGSSMVFRLETPDGLLAAKLLRPAYHQNPRALAQLQAEQAHLNMLRGHPRFPHLRLCLPLGVLWDWLPGSPLSEGPPVARVSLRADLTAAIEALAAHGLCHGDLTARNILISPSGRATVLDLGCCGPGDPAIDQAALQRILDR